MVTNTLNPSFEEARKPLAYLGTRSELENEILRLWVYDWDFFSADDLIGQADVPLNGLLEYGQVSSAQRSHLAVHTLLFTPAIDTRCSSTDRSRSS